MRGIRGLTILLFLLGVLLLPRDFFGGTISPVAAASRAAAPIAHVRYIQHGLTVQPPRTRPGKGRVKQSLFSRYGLQTKRTEKASINFQDGTLLHLNQLTSAVLRSATVTQIMRGEVEEQVVPGTSHQVQTAAAVAAAVGTVFDVLVRGKVTIITVVEGAVLVQTAQGSVLVKSGQQVRITKGQPPPQPQPVDAAAATSWTFSIPPPSAPLGLNIALDANGGNIYRWTSQRDDPAHTFDAHNANDGRTDRGWQSAAGQTTDQSLWVRFEGLKTYTITGIFLDCAATGGQDPTNAARDFEILVSNDGSGFATVFSGTCAQDNTIQMFPFARQAGGADARADAYASSSIKAAALQFRFKNNHGGKEGIAVAEVGVIGQEEPAVLGTPTPEPTDTPTPTPTPTMPGAASLSGPSSVDFGQLLYNQTSPVRSVTITNIGQSPTTIQRLDLQEQYQTIFNILGDTCVGHTLQPGESCTVNLTFDPLPMASTQGGLIVTYTGSSTLLTIPLTGQAYYLAITPSPLQASWTSPLDDPDKNHLLTTTITACATYTQVAWEYTINDTNPNGDHNAHGQGLSGTPLSEPILASGIDYRNPDGSLIWRATAYIRFVGVESGQVQVQYTAQITGSGSTFQILTPVVTPQVTQVEQCPAPLQPLGRTSPPIQDSGRDQGVFGTGIRSPSTRIASTRSLKKQTRLSIFGHSGRGGE